MSLRAIFVSAANERLESTLATGIVAGFCAMKLDSQDSRDSETKQHGIIGITNFILNKF